jgi:hypothetical protein
VPAHGRAGRGGDPAGREDDPGSVDENTTLRAWHGLSRDEQRAAIKKLAADGMSDYGIAHATRLAVEQVRAILAEPSP